MKTSMSITKLLDKPMFIIGSPRSGTSLLRLVMTTHSQILIPPECGFIIWLQKKYADWNVSYNSDPVRVGGFLVDLFASKKFDTWLMDKDVIETQIALHKPASFAELCAVVYLAFGALTGKDFSVWGDKNNFYLNHIAKLQQLYDGARFLHIVRDGRDVACSYREVMSANSSSPYAPKLDTEISRIATEWSDNVTKVDSLLAAMPREAAMTIRYEDLVGSPRQTISIVCNWLGVKFEGEMLNFHQQNVKNKLEPELTLDWKKRTLKPISDDTVGRYARLLNEEELNRFLGIAEPALLKFSYL